MTKLLGISGSLRKDSTNTKLLKEAARLSAFDSFELGDTRMPLYDGDFEAEGLPDEVVTLGEQVRAADAIVISTPEYNGSLPGVLKNALDWLSRLEDKVLKDKPIAVLSAAAGRTGGARAQYALRLCLVYSQANVLQAPEVMIPASFKAFDEEGRLVDEDSVKFLSEKMAALKARVYAKSDTICFNENWKCFNRSIVPAGCRPGHECRGIGWGLLRRCVRLGLALWARPIRLAVLARL